MQHTMQVKSSIHNRFDIEVRDAITGEVKNRLYAENIVLDQMYTRLCGGSAYFAYIAYGTGSGTLAASRTSLFTHKGMKAAVNDATNKALPTSWWRQKIVLNPEDEVGTVITEVGIAYGSASSNLVTHAMLRDMNGNIVSLTKTSLDIITIYATVYVTFSTSNENIVLCGMPGNNPLVNYLIGGTAWPTYYIFTGESHIAEATPFQATLSAVVGTSAALTWTADTANKKRKASTIRFPVGGSNGELTEISCGSNAATGALCRLLLPAPGIYAGLDITGATVGMGDGIETRFILPSRNVKIESVVIKADGTIIGTNNARVKSTNWQYAAPRAIITAGDAGAVSGDGLAIALKSLLPPYLGLYNKVDGEYRLTTTPTQPKNVMDVVYSENKLVIALANQTDILVYDWSGSAWVQRALPSGLSSNINNIAMSRDGNVLAASSTSSPYLRLWDWSGSAWVARVNPGTMPGGSCQAGPSLSLDGVVVAYAKTTSPYFKTCDWSGSAWVDRADPADAPGGSLTDCKLSLNGLVLAVCFNASPYVNVYDWSGSAWIKRANPAVAPSAATHVAISPDGNVLIMDQTTTPFIQSYDWINSAWIKRAAPTVAGSASGSVFMSDDAMVILAHGPRIFDGSANATQVVFSTPPGLVTGEAVGVGDGTTTLFSLDYTPVSGLSIYLDGVATTDYTRDGTSITFTAAPGSGVVITADYKYAPVITADYTVNGIHKTTARVIDISAEISFGEGS